MINKEYGFAKSPTNYELTDFSSPIDYRLLMKTLQGLSEKYPFIGITYMGTSILGRGIPLVTLGEGNGRSKNNNQRNGGSHNIYHATDI